MLVWKNTNVLTERKLIRVVKLELCCLKQGESSKGSAAHNGGKSP